jgi:hypothetical protein
MKVNEVSPKMVLKIVNSAGQPAKVDGMPKWSVDAALASLAVSEDGMSAVLTALAAGVALVQVTADADLGEGVKELLASKAYEITDDEAVAISIEEEVLAV